MAKVISLFLLVAVAGFAVTGCGDGANHANDPDTHGESAGSKLELNDGKKWAADSHTRESMAGIAEVLKADQSSNAADYNALGKDLKVRVDALVVGCTMTGPEHEQLHVFLNEFIPTIDQLASAADQGEAQKARHDVSDLVEEYGKYFE